jgi:hypothetical protein
MTRWIETDTLANQNISSALAIGTCTVDADRLMICDVSIYQAAGGGDYSMYVSRSIGGTATETPILPKTTMTAAAGETDFSGQSGLITARNGDVLKVYIDGLAGDTTTPDTTVRWFELAALRPTTADRTLDVTATGAAGIDWSNVENKTSTVDLSATTIKGSEGAGATSWEITVNDGTNPLDGVEVWITTDSAGTNVVASGSTDALGQVTFYLDAGTYYCWKQLAGYGFTNPETMVVT